MASIALPLIDSDRETSSKAELPLVLDGQNGQDVMPAEARVSPSPHRAHARKLWQNAALRANPQLDAARLEQVSARLARQKDGHTSISLFSIAGERARRRRAGTAGIPTRGPLRSGALLRRSGGSARCRARARARAD
jgi:hypothetical protein